MATRTTDSRFNEPFDRPMDGADNTNRLSHVLANILCGFLEVLFKIAFRLTRENVEYIRACKGKTGAVIVSNHTSYLEVITMYLGPRWKQFARPMARDTLFKIPVLGKVFTYVGAFPVKRDEADLKAIKRAVRFLKNREMIFVYPEGTRRGKGSKVPTLHNGVALMARMAHVPMIPASTVGADRVMPPGKPFIRFPKMTIRYGAPVEISEFDFLPKPERLDAATWFVMRESFALHRGCAPEDVDMRELFPESRDYSREFAEHPIRRGIASSDDKK